jgi:hypothetical protein
MKKLLWIHPVQYRDQLWTHSEHGNEPSGSVKGGEFPDQWSLSSRLLLIEVSYSLAVAMQDQELLFMT